MQKVFFFCFFAYFSMSLIGFDENHRNFARMRLHIFNPGHDIALAANKAPFTAPHAARQLQHDLAFIAATWANSDDMVLVDDKTAAKEAVKRLSVCRNTPIFIEPDNLSFLQNVDVDEVCVWGWDKAIKRQLADMGIKDKNIIPSDGALETWRDISGRAWAAENILAPVVETNERLIGSARKVLTTGEALSPGYGDAWVLKSPWSSSGRGVRYVRREQITSHLEGWIKNTIEKQGYLMAEPFYCKILDLATEFYSDGKGNVEYLGLSLFETKNGAYVGNIIAPEERKREAVEKYISLDVLDEATKSLKNITEKTLGNSYHGHFGIDMMIVADPQNGICLHPCVELNLRRTMGYVALCMQSAPDIKTKVMRIEYDKKYRMRIAESEDEIWR